MKHGKKYTTDASQYVCNLLYIFNLCEKYASSWFWIILVKTEYAISWFHTVWELTWEWILERMHRLPILLYLLGKKHGKNIHLMRLSTCVSSFLYIQSLWKVCFFLILDYSGKNLVCHQLISYSMRTYLRVNSGENAPITYSCVFTCKKAWINYTSHASQYVCVISFIYSISLKSMLLPDFGLFW